MTNYERIKAMSVEEMAELLTECNDVYAIRIEDTYEGICKDAFVKWLNSEV